MTHYNPPSRLPIVGAWFIILVDGIEHKVMRTSYISNKEDNLVYFTEDGNKIEGRYEWRHT